MPRHRHVSPHLKNLDKAPFPWFGGKSRAAAAVWALLGDVPHYVEPFFGGGAVLLGRPHPCNRPYYSETVNDLDGFVVNFWRSIQWYPDLTAEAASWPVTESDKQARQVALLRWRDAGAGERLAGDAVWCDPVMAGWWAWAVSVQIGAFAGDGAWIADPVTGCLVRQPRAPREPGVARNRPHLTNNGRGVNHAGTREPGVLDPATEAHAHTALDSTDWGEEYHDRTMPELIRWFRHLAARLRHVRVVNGDWARVVTTGAAWTLPVRSGHGPCGVFLDPPYGTDADRADGLYAADDGEVAGRVREWCLRWGDHERYRIVVAGFAGEGHEDLIERGWTEHEWWTDGYLAGGMANIGEDEHQQHRERLWASPGCVTPETSEQGALW